MERTGCSLSTSHLVPVRIQPGRLLAFLRSLAPGVFLLVKEVS
jgi:hypothetical protein